MTVRLGISAALALTLAAPALAQETDEESGKVTPLFAEETVLDITLTGPIKEIARAAERSMRPYPATLAAAGENQAIQLSARGKSRRMRENCRFPPLRIAFNTKPEKPSLFRKQNRLKLVTHCREQSSYDQYLLREYAVYRIYNVVTPESLKARLARITYVDEGKVVTERPGFLIEDADDAARRLGMKEVDSGDLTSDRIDRDDAARYSLFQYLIGNTDWAMIVGPDPTDCCHNSKLLGPAKDATSGLTPLPYDFDNSGLVDAPYAYPNATLGTRSVTERVYRGFCSLNALIPAEAERLRALRPQIEAEISAIPGLNAKTQKSMLKYLSEGFDDMKDQRSIERKLLRKCR